MSQPVKGYILVCEAAEEPPSKQVVVSDTDDVTIIETVLQDGDRVNRNKRLYPASVLELAIKSDYINERIKTKSFYGEAGHPMKADMQRQLTIDHDCISHIISKIWMEGKRVMGIVETARTKSGKNLQGLIRQKSVPGFSMRGVGPVVEQKKDFVEIKSPLSIFAYDWVKFFR